MGFYFAMCYIYSMQEIIDIPNYQEKEKKPIKQYNQPKMIVRLGAAALDLAIYILLSLIIISIIGFALSNDPTSGLSKSNALIDEHIKSSQLAKIDEKKGYLAYDENDVLTLEDNSSLVINKLEYFYLSYLTGHDIEEGYTYSLDKDTPVKDDILPETYYSVAYFNENVLSLPKENEEAKLDFFIYQKDGDNDDYSQVGIINPKYIGEVVIGEETVKRINNVPALVNYLLDQYNKAVKLFYDQSFMKRASKTIETTNSVALAIASLPSFIIFYLIIPLCSPFGKSIGKHLLSLAVVSHQGYIVKKWQIIVRSLPILGATVYICLVPSLYFQLMVPIILLLISMGFFVFDPKRRAMHDFMALTCVIKAERGMIIYPDEEHYQQALSIIEEKEKQNG